MTDIVWRLKTAASHADAGPATCRVLITEALEAAEEIERLSDEVREWREMDDQIRNFVGGKRDGRNTLEIVKEKFTAKWDDEDHSYRLLLDSYTHPIIELLQAENEQLRVDNDQHLIDLEEYRLDVERLRSALEDVYDQCSAWPFLLMTSRRVKTIIRAALGWK